MDLNKDVTVDDAIKKGQRMVTYMVLVLLLVLCGLFIFVLQLEVGPVAVVGPLGFILIIIVPMLYGLTAVTRWRIWAFTNVRNVHELKQRAIIAQLIGKDGSFTEKLVIRTAWQKEQLALIQQKLDEPEVFTDDLNVPYESVFYYPKSEKIVTVIMAIGCVIGSGYGFLNNQIPLGVLLLICAIIFGYAYKRMANRAPGPAVTLSNEGITVNGTGFDRWSDISNEKVYRQGSGKHARFYLSYEANNNIIELQLSSLGGKKPHIIHHLLKVYRARNMKGTR